MLRLALLLLSICSLSAFQLRYATKFARRSDLAMVFDWKTSKKATEERMGKSLESLQSQLNTLRAGGANPNILDRVSVPYFGSPTPLTQLARVGTSGAMQLVIEPFEKSTIRDIEKAILTSDLNLTPSCDGNVIRIVIPPLTEDRRKELVKQAGMVCETGKVSIRNIRRDVVEKIKLAEKDKDIGKDDSKGFQVRRTNFCLNDSTVMLVQLLVVQNAFHSLGNTVLLTVALPSLVINRHNTGRFAEDN